MPSRLISTLEMSENYKTTSFRVSQVKELRTLKNGTVLYEVTAFDADGTEIVGLRSFTAALDIGRELEYTLKRYEHPKYGTTWTILDPSGVSAKNVKDAETRIKTLEARVNSLEERLGAEPQPPIHPAQHKLGEEVRGPDFFSDSYGGSQ